jgi:hypothetical protein
MPLRRAAASLQNSNYRGIRGEYADSNRERYGEAEKEGHEKRNHSQPPYLHRSIRCRKLNFRLLGFSNLPALEIAASDDPDSLPPDSP